MIWPLDAFERACNQKFWTISTLTLLKYDIKPAKFMEMKDTCNIHQLHKAGIPRVPTLHTLGSWRACNVLTSPGHTDIHNLNPRYKESTTSRVIHLKSITFKKLIEVSVKLFLLNSGAKNNHESKGLIPVISCVRFAEFNEVT